MKQTSQRSLLFRQNVNRTEEDRRRVCPRQGGRGMKTRLRPRRRAVDRATIVSIPEIWYTTTCKEERSLRYVYNGNTQGGLQEKACKNRPRQNAGRVARFYPQTMCHARWCKGLSGVCWPPSLSQWEVDRYPYVIYDAAAHRIGFWLSWMLPRCGGCCFACRWRVLDFKRKRLRLAGKWYLFLGRRSCTSPGVGCEEVWTGQCGSPWCKNKSGTLFGFDGCRHVSDSWAHLSGVGRFRCQTADQWQVAAQARLSCHKHGDSTCGNGAWFALRHGALSVCRGRACVSKFAFLRSLAYPDICKKSVGNSFPIPRRIGFLSLPHFSERQGPDFRPALHRIAEAQRSVYNPSRGSVSIVPNICLWRNRVWRQTAPSDGVVCECGGKVV